MELLYSHVHILSKHICQNCWETVKNLVYKWCKSAPVEWESTLGKHSFFFHKEEDAYSLDCDKWTINIFIIQFVSFPTRRYNNACIFGPFGILLSCTVNLFFSCIHSHKIYSITYILGRCPRPFLEVILSPCFICIRICNKCIRDNIERAAVYFALFCAIDMSLKVGQCFEFRILTCLNFRAKRILKSCSNGFCTYNTHLLNVCVFIRWSPI